MTTPTKTRDADSPAALAAFARAYPCPPDPPVPASGGCAGCGKPRTAKVGISKQAGTNRRALELAGLDPFCSTKCCRAWHGCALAAVQASAWDDEEIAERMRGAIGERSIKFGKFARSE